MERLPSNIDTSNSSETYNRDYKKEEAYLRAKKKVEKIKGFYGHLASYVIVNIFILSMIGFNLDTGETFWKFGHFSTAFFWGIGLAFHAAGVFGPDFLLGKKWEERKIKEYMSDNRRNWE
ncbi:2TM domain protein [Kordia sp. SMS9]|uniref:2TM domain-containing protein n=1 Tax=Kordia sp. SMS9 TaxID=2282170 RepID=UPI000E0D8F89|nr:2TM domain-containing protein [Kordia sp. SMS9]AXG70509.1 2TM domain protein [Kordia sp. SMS9]